MIHARKLLLLINILVTFYLVYLSAITSTKEIDRPIFVLPFIDNPSFYDLRILIHTVAAIGFVLWVIWGIVYMKTGE